MLWQLCSRYGHLGMMNATFLQHVVNYNHFHYLPFLIFLSFVSHVLPSFHQQPIYIPCQPVTFLPSTKNPYLPKSHLPSISYLSDLTNSYFLSYTSPPFTFPYFDYLISPCLTIHYFTFLHLHYHPIPDFPLPSLLYHQLSSDTLLSTTLTNNYRLTFIFLLHRDRFSNRLTRSSRNVRLSGPKSSSGNFRRAYW